MFLLQFGWNPGQRASLGGDRVFFEHADTESPAAFIMLPFMSSWTSAFRAATQSSGDCQELKIVPGFPVGGIKEDLGCGVCAIASTASGSSFLRMWRTFTAAKAIADDSGGCALGQLPWLGRPKPDFAVEFPKLGR